MKHFASPLESLRRPKLLISAARHGLSDYDRATALRRILGSPAPLEGRWYLADLVALEDAQNDRRKERDARYSIARHVDLLVALLAENAAMLEAASS
ncbi:hypothetical protein ILP92_09625 [Maribius pontilimi]|uniref:Uncharacterized protein n=1 Tax=Palleronia pontilimi TaxID=1964209 RepID=A0A934IH54_9RHOB|nr:DUF6477 family protein [Palleronia pontilimi]MBJ3763002.1 hypothetical protein [Palleronia pontilimi]